MAHLLKDILKDVVLSWDNTEQQGKNKLNEVWYQVIGEKAGVHTKPAYLKDGKLVVTVSGSSWLYQLSLIRLLILHKLNKKLDKDNKIKQLKFKIGKI